MSSEKVIDGRLAIIAIQRWKSDKDIQEQFKSASEYYDFLTVKISTSESIKKIRTQQ